MKYPLLCAAQIVALCLPAMAQDIMGDVMSGALVKPKVGVFAWYELSDVESGKKFFLRQAIVDKERVGRKDGYWLETEVRPQVGFPVVYKMLVTGPARDPGNVHRLIVQDGDRPAEEMEVDEASAGEAPPEAAREFVGDESIETANGPVAAKHYVVREDSAETHVWLNDQVRPMGIVKMTSTEGTLMLQQYGEGGEDSQSAVGRNAGDSTSSDTSVRVQAEGGVTKNFGGRKDADE